MNREWWKAKQEAEAITEAPQTDQPLSIDGLKEHLRHKEAELAYLKKQKAMVKFEVKALRRLVENAKQ